jgi:uncharacterized protein (TIGR03437 family)
MRCNLFFLSVLLTAATFAQVPPITSGYGANGSFTASEARFPSPLYAEQNVVVFRPNTNAPAPVVFFAPGFSVQTPDNYRPLIQHIVSRGYAVVFSPFQVLALDLNEQRLRYNTIWAGFEEAVNRYGASFDLTRVAFLGHSFGGGASFAMLQRGAVGKGWGRNGLALFALAPWYVYEITARQLIEFPQHAKMLVQVYEDDTVNDHRIAKEIFERVNLPASEKDFVLLRSDAYEGVSYEASHGTPSGLAPNALDYYGIWRLFDALADAAFNSSATGQALALGNGSAAQRFMGEWPAANGKAARPVRESLAGDCVPLARTTGFTFNYDQTINALGNVSAASYQAALAPNAIASAFGKDLAAQTASATTAMLPTTLNGVTIKVRDSACIERLAPLFFVSPTQINYLIPPETTTGQATVSAYSTLPSSNVPASQNGGAVSLGTINLANVAPALFTANGNGQGVAAALIFRLRADGSQSYEPISRYDETAKRFVALPVSVNNPNEQAFLILFGTGWRNRSALSAINVTAGGVTLETLFAGAQGALAGLDQLNARLPATLTGRGEVDVQITVEGQRSNVVRVSFQ